MTEEKPIFKKIGRCKWTNVFDKKGRHLEVWLNGYLSNLAEGSICKNCERTNPDSEYSTCPIAKKLYKICEESEMSIIVTRCGARDKELGNLLYVPREK